MLKDMEWFRKNKRKKGQLTGSSQYVDEIEKKLERGWNFGGKEDRENQKNKSVPFLRVSEGKSGGINGGISGRTDGGITEGIDRLADYNRK